MQTHDWSASAMGEPAAWPASLKTVSSLMLHSKMPAFLAWGPALCMLYNDAYSDILGQKHPAALGRPLYDVWPELRPEIEPLVNQTLAGEPVYFENAMFTLRRSGQDEQAWFNFSYAPIEGANGTVDGLYGCLTETTAQVRAEKIRQAETQRLDAVLEAAPVGIVLTDARGRLTRVNPANRKLWGDPPLATDVHGAPCWKGWWADGSARHGHLLAAPEWALARALQGEEAPRDIVEIEPFGQPGTRRTILNCGAPVRDTDGGIIGAVIAQMDITDRVGIEAVLREAVAKYHTIANAIPQIVWGARPDGYHEYYNQQWYDYTGVAPGSTDGTQWKGLFHPEDQAAALQRWSHSLESGQPYEIEYRLRHHSGEYRWVLGRALPVRDAQGAIVRWMGTCTDIHEQKLAQQSLQLSDRLKDEFLAMLAHELRNPLAPIATAAELLSRGTLDEEGVWQLSEVISRQARHMTHLIDNLLDVSRVTRGQVTLERQPVALQPILAEAIEQVMPLLQAKSQSLGLQLACPEARVSGDRLRLVQVLANVLNNAIKYTPEGGRITVRTLADAGWLKIVVCDNGIGMNRDLVRVAFDLFTQGERGADRAQGGLGIGLALVRSLVVLHGGTVGLQSDGAGLGSELTISLPRLPQDDGPPPGDEVSDPPGVPASVPLRVMVVDDNADAARLLGMFVELLGHEVFVQFHPASALECAQQVRPHVCLLDIGLPDIDGYALARQLRLLPGMQNVRLAAVTGYSQPRDKKAAHAAGFNAHFAKPVDAQQVEAWLSEAAAQARGTATAMATATAAPAPAKAPA